MYRNPKIINALGGIQVETDEGVFVYLAPGTGAHQEAMNCEFGEVEAFVPEPPGPDPRIAFMAREIEEHIEAVAKGRGYSSAVSCVSYAASTEKAWAADAKVFISWRDAVWRSAIAAQARAVETGEAPDDVLTTLPPIVWP